MKFEIKKKLPKIEVKLVQIIQNLLFFVFFLSSVSLHYLFFINRIFKLMYLIDFNILNLMICLTLHINCKYIIIFIG